MVGMRVFKGQVLTPRRQHLIHDYKLRHGRWVEWHTVKWSPAEWDQWHEWENTFLREPARPKEQVVKYRERVSSEAPRVDNAGASDHERPRVEGI